METAIAALIILTVVLFGALTIAQVYLSSQDAIMTSWREMEERLGERARTEISAVGPGTVGPDTTVVITLTNEGSTKLADFDQWDVIVQYYTGSYNSGDYVVKWLPYREAGLPINEWKKVRIYLEPPDEEVFEPEIFNPEEEMVIQIGISSPVGQPTTNTVTIATPNGISATAVFTY